MKKHIKPNKRIIKDPYQYPFYRAYGQCKNQAQWRGEEWNLTFEEWFNAWGDKIEQRGRGAHQYAMIRVNQSLPWSKDNVTILNRKEQTKLINSEAWRRKQAQYKEMSN